MVHVLQRAITAAILAVAIVIGMLWTAVAIMYLGGLVLYLVGSGL